MSDLAGATVSVGTQGSGTRVVANILLAAHGIADDAADFADVEPDELAQSFVDGELEAAFVIAEPGADSIVELLRVSATNLHQAHIE